MYLCCLDDAGFISPITSKAHPLNGNGFTMACNSLARTCWMPSCIWHSWHSLVNSIQSFNIEGQDTPVRISNHFILCPSWCAPHAPLCTLGTATYASLSPRHLSNTPSTVFLNNSFSIKTKLKARYFILRSVEPVGERKYSTKGFRQSLSCPLSIAKISKHFVSIAPNFIIDKSEGDNEVALTFFFTWISSSFSFFLYPEASCARSLAS